MSTADRRTHARNVYSRQLAASVRTEDALQALAAVIGVLLPGRVGYLLRSGEQGWEGWLAAGDHREVAEGIRITSADDIEEAQRTGSCLPSTLDVRGRSTEVLLVPAGPPTSGTLLALVPDPQDGGIEQATRELAIAVASEAWATLRRLEVLGELEAKVEILEAIAGIAGAVGLETAEVAEHITTHAAGALSCERAALYLLHDEGRRGELVALHASDRDWTAPDHRLQRIGEETAVQIVARGGSLLEQDVATCPWIEGPFAAAEGAVSVYAMPLEVGEDVIGVLVVAHTQANPRGFTSLCTQVGAALSRQASLAVANAKLYDAQREAAERLRLLDRQRADYMVGITHDLRSPVTAVLGFARTISQAGDLLSEEERLEALETIERQSLRMSRMLDDMLDSARAEAGELVPDRRVAVPLHLVVQEAIAATGSDHRPRLRPTLDRDVTVWGDADQLVRVVQNLLANAVRYAPGKAPVDIAVHRDGAQGVLTVVDSGPGIPTGLDAFTRFGRGDFRGTGLGLYTVKRIVELHDGTIDLSVTPGGGVTVTVRLPCVDPDRTA